MCCEMPQIHISVLCGCVLDPTSGTYWVELGFLNNWKELQYLLDQSFGSKSTNVTNAFLVIVTNAKKKKKKKKQITLIFLAKSHNNPQSLDHLQTDLWDFNFVI
jgi:hypothetical protein